MIVQLEPGETSLLKDIKELCNNDRIKRILTYGVLRGKPLLIDKTFSHISSGTSSPIDSMWSGLSVYIPHQSDSPFPTIFD